jgi:acyl dehydratase
MSDDSQPAGPGDATEIPTVIPTAFATPADDRYFEDYRPGDVYDFSQRITVEQDALIAFARQFDPQSFHIDPVQAATGPYDGLIASGWHTAAIMMRLYVDQYGSAVASFGGPAADELRWLHPVRPGDQLRLRTTVLNARRSESKPDRGIVRILCELENQRDVLVFTATIVSLIGTRAGRDEDPLSATGRI